MYSWYRITTCSRCLVGKKLSIFFPNAEGLSVVFLLSIQSVVCRLQKKLGTVRPENSRPKKCLDFRFQTIKKYLTCLYAINIFLKGSTKLTLCIIFFLYGEHGSVLTCIYAVMASTGLKKGSQAGECLDCLTIFACWQTRWYWQSGMEVPSMTR